MGMTYWLHVAKARLSEVIRRRFHRLAERPGALERFLADRGE